jgi:hypothetical protein
MCTAGFGAIGFREQLPPRDRFPGSVSTREPKMTHTLRLLVCAGALALGTGAASAQYYQAYPSNPGYPVNCDAYARNYASQVARPGGQVLGGAAFGALAGAGIGAVVGGQQSIGTGAAIGAAGGALLGASTSNWNGAYRYAYNNCIQSVRYNPPPPVYTAPPVAYYPAPPVYVAPAQPSYGRPYAAWSQAWFSYCSSRFRSFDPQTGNYLGFDGQYHFCQG